MPVQHKCGLERLHHIPKAAQLEGHGLRGEEASTLGELAGMLGAALLLVLKEAPGRGLSSGEHSP